MKTQSYTFPWGVYIGDLLDKDNTIPLCIDSRDGGFCVLFDEKSEEVANNFIENIALKLFEVMPTTSLEVDIFDFGRPRFMKLSALKKANLYRVLYSKNRASDRFDILDELKNERIHNLLSFDTPTLNEYNKENEEREKFYLLLINLDDFPDETTSPKRVKNFFETSWDAGFYTIVYGSKELLDSKLKSTQALLNKFNTIKIEDTQFEISDRLFEFKELLKEYEFEYVNDNKERIIKQILHKLEQNSQNSKEKDFLSVEIGTIGKEKIYFNMGLNSQNHHAFLAGMTRMGKTNLLNNIIVNIAKNYTAKEIELYLMDYKPAGAEFIIFKNHPNCKKIFLENQDPTPALQMLQEFQEEMYKRAKVLNGKNIDEYNTKNPNSILPRKILIIDEIQRMFSGSWSESNTFNALLEDIIKAGAGFGLHLILTTQSLKEINMKESIMGQIPLKLSFRLSDSIEAMKIFKDNQEASKKVLNLQKYQFVYSDFNKTIVAKANYLEKDKIEQILIDIRNQRLDNETLTPLIYKNSNKTQKEPITLKPQNNLNLKYSTDSAKELLEKLKKAGDKR